MRILFFCGALAAGEFAASFAPTWAEAWPVAATLSLLVALFGYGLCVRGWPFAAVFLAGVALFLSASVEQERLYREKPWMRGKPSYERQGHEASRGFASELKADLSRRVGLGLDADREAASLNRAILLGERARLPKRLKDVFVASGTMHVFAISGLHVMAVAGVLMFLLALTFLPQRLTGAVALPILWGYVYLVGCAPSAVRAALMASFCLMAPIFWRRPDLLQSWALAFLLVHVCRPQQITDVGNVLSFTVMLAIALAVESGRLMGFRISFFWITVVAWAAGVPIAAHVFGQVAPGGILANLILITAAECTVVSGAVGVVVSFVSETAAAHCNNLSALCTKGMVGISELVSRIPGSSFEVPRWTLLQCAEWYALIVLIVFLVFLRRSRNVV